DLNQYQDFQKFDSLNMLAEMNGLPEQLESAWSEAQALPLSDFKGIKKVLITGMGGSAIGASLLKAYAAPIASVPIEVHRDYGLPAWANGKDTLVIVSSHSGNTEETLSAMETALERGCSLLAISTGGKIADLAREKDVDLWIFNHKGQPRAAVGYSFCLLLNVFFRLEFLPDPKEEIKDAVAEMQKGRDLFAPELPDHHNPAKRLAGQLIDRWVSVFAADLLAPVARRWKGQISEIAKAWGQFEALPEADHNTLAGIVNPEANLVKTMALFLQADANHPRNQRRIELTKKGFMIEGLCTDLVQATGKTRLAQMWNLIQFGDFTAYYLAMAYDVDPTPVAAIENLKREL
ncbi:MAG: bifunctional phosphoglucose/phosphomannose isomerase, partial [Anaerolineales bacterium]|nr:bifunctional phosphoglucose/phosphomannose isomerase [Anaerolineales bacterium]